jgi:O-antigen ligase
LNLLSAVEVVDAGRAVFFLSTTLYLVVFAIWIASWVDSRRKATLVVDSYVAAAVVCALFGTLALFVAYPGSDLLVDDDRARGFFKDPNIYVSFLVPAAVIMAERAIASGVALRRRLLSALLFLTLVMGVLFSYSRAGWLGLAVALLVLTTVLFVRWESRRVIVLLAIVAAAGGIALGTVVATGSGDFLIHRTQLQDYDEQRFGAQLYGIDQSMRYPLGIGPGQYEVLGPIAAHSLYVRALAEHGLLGLLTLLGLVVATLALALRNAMAGRDTYGIASAALLAAWCGLLANSFFIDSLHWRHLWLIAALIWAASMPPPRPAGKPTD